MPRRTVKVIRQRQAFTQLRDSTGRAQQDQSTSDIWAPGGMLALQILLSCRLAAALWSPISDCDEVYNYWEPLHFLLYGRGFQTWEYSPIYAIRSYAYISFHYWPIRLFNLFVDDAKTTFYISRCFLSLTCACSDLLFYTCVLRKFGNSVGRLTLVFQAFGAGYFVSSAAFLPSSFAMAMTAFAYACWMDGYDAFAIFFIAISALMGWPFAALLGVPIAVDMLTDTSPCPPRAISRCKLFFIYSSVIGAAVGGGMIYCDTTFYGKLTLAPFNIIRYNIFTPHGPDLYGVAPLSYYIVNLLLNWNIAALLACLTLPLTAVAFWRQYGLQLLKAQYALWWPVVLVQLGYWLWLGTFFLQPHKEERFLYPAYSLLCLSASLSLDCYQRMISSFAWLRGRFDSLRRSIADVPVISCLLVFVFLSISRSVGQYRNFHGPLDVYHSLNGSVSPAGDSTGPVNICVGKEWYRYPSSFFLPPSAQLQFIKSEFAGLLPKPYPVVRAGYWIAVVNATSSVPSDMNDMNKEELSRYVDVSTCDYLIDLDTGSAESVLEPNYSADNETWTVITTARFLISGKSPAFFRAFYLPVLSEKYCIYGMYNLLERKR